MTQSPPSPPTANRPGPGRFEREALLALCALAGVAACGLTGGITGPLAVACLAPVCVAALTPGDRALAAGAALSLVAAAVCALAEVAGLTGKPPGDTASLGLGVIAVDAVAVALAAALFTRRRHPQDEAEVPAETFKAPEASGLLDEFPGLLLQLDAHGRIRRCVGAGLGPRGDLAHSEEGGLPALADPSSHAAVAAALSQAFAEGRASVRFTAAGEAGLVLNADIRRISPAEAVAALRDATADHAREQMLETARADAEGQAAGKARFLANMSHELRTPLNAIIGFSDIMRQKLFGTLPAKYQEYVELIHDAGGHLLDLINDVLDMSKIEAERYELTLETLDAREPVQAALRLLRVQADDAGVQLRGLLPSQPLEVCADRRALKQITLNLVSNALKFTPKGGLVTVGLHRSDGAMELSVADTGVGIAMVDLQRLGRPFEQAGDAVSQGKGTGLGLSLVRAFAELHGGRMDIESALGEGTAVTVRLPVLTAEAPPPPADAEPPPPQAGAKVIAFSADRR